MSCRSCSRPRGRAFTLIELLVVIGIVFLLLAVLLPSLNFARARLRELMCANNLRQWGTATTYYREEFDDYLPGEGTYLRLDDKTSWFNVLPPYLGAPRYADVERNGELIEEYPDLHVWICPAKNANSPYYKSWSGKNQFHYGMNMVLDGMESTLTPDFPDRGPEHPIWARDYAREPNTVFMFDIYDNQMAGKQENVGHDYHGTLANVLFLDTGVSSFHGPDFVEKGDFDNPRPIWNHPQLYWGYRPGAR
ncbi:MAG: type II secretion system protein [Phycisphaerae bacterium]|nr:type II secretion system protein [Phycisphaerae bacterium]